MLQILLIGGLASLFYKIGDDEYGNKGWIMALISVVLSFLGAALFGFLGTLGMNALLYVGILAYNYYTDKPPGGQGGF
jgi:hypothetical protein